LRKAFESSVLENLAPCQSSLSNKPNTAPLMLLVAEAFKSFQHEGQSICRIRRQQHRQKRGNNSLTTHYIKLPTLYGGKLHDTVDRYARVANVNVPPFHGGNRLQMSTSSKFFFTKYSNPRAELRDGRH
jgi:hypothetical protein